jgi:hypothetical protein
MVGTITPVVYGNRRVRWLLGVGCYGLGAVLAGTALGAGAGLAGLLLRTVLAPDVVSASVAAAAQAYALHELGLIRLPRPQRRWQVPAHWRVTLHPWLTCFLYGLILGAGVLTYISGSSFYIAVAWATALSDPAAGAVVLAVYGSAQAVAILLAGWNITSCDAAFRRGLAVVGYRPSMHLANGVALSGAAAFLAVRWF